jgi:hypothetical protein
MTTNLGQGKIVDGHADPRSLKGVERRRELREEDAAEIERIAGHLIAGLGREPIGAEFVAAELAARTLVKIRRLAERGRDDSSERELLSRLMVTTPFGMVPAPPPVPPKFNPVGARAPGATFWVAEKGDDTAPDEVSSSAG